MDSGKTQDDFVRAISSPNECRCGDSYGWRKECATSHLMGKWCTTSCVGSERETLPTYLPTYLATYLPTSLPPCSPPFSTADPVEKEIAAIAKASSFLPERYFSFGLCKTMEALGVEVRAE